jgi:hypothetical protein
MKEDVVAVKASEGSEHRNCIRKLFRVLPFFGGADLVGLLNDGLVPGSHTISTHAVSKSAFSFAGS